MSTKDEICKLVEAVKELAAEVKLLRAAQQPQYFTTSPHYVVHDPNIYRYPYSHNTCYGTFVMPVGDPALTAG